MNRQITFQQYRAIDLTILAVMLALSQFVIHFASSVLYPEQLYVVSPAAAMVAIVMMRWNGYAAIHAVLSGVLFTLFAGGTAQHFVIYGAGNLLCLPALLVLKIFGKERVRKDGLLSGVFGLAVQILMWLGRAGSAYLLGFAPAACIGFITTDILSGLFTLAIVWVVRRIEGLFEDQKHYLLRLESERQDEGRELF
nr:hypothetical protein [Oscillospiraceae bacterium]